MKGKYQGKTGRRMLQALMAAVMLSALALSYTVSAIIHPLNEESIGAYFREQAAANYGRLVSERIGSLRNINGLILDNPTLYQQDMQRVTDYFISLLQPLYVTIIIVIGIYLMFFSGSPAGRAKAKSSLWIAIFAIGLITASPHMLMLFFSISKSVTLLVLSLAPVDTEGPFIHAADYMVKKGMFIMSHSGADYSMGDERGGIPILLATYLIFEGILLLLKLRFYMVAVLAMILPFTITLYAFIPTRNIGKLLTEQTILWTLTQVAMAIVLIVIAIGINLTESITSFTVTEYLRFMMEIAGLIMLIVTPLFFVKSFRGFL
jgi:hypothetical protein